MRLGWTALAATCLLSLPAYAQSDALQSQYAHVQDLNNAAWHLISTQPGDARTLDEAVTSLQQSLAATERMQLSFDEDASLATDTAFRHCDALRMLADAYALQGRRDDALNALEALLRAPLVTSSTAELLEKDPALESLREQPRYRAVLASLKRMDRQWKAPAIAVASSELNEAQRVAGLSLFWSEARYNFVHFDAVPDLDWNQAYLDFLPQVIAAADLRAYYDVLRRFAPLLHDGHTTIVPPKSLWDAFFARPPIRTALVQGHVLVTEVNSSALASKVRVGDEVMSVDGQDVHEYARQHVLPYASVSTPQDAQVHMYDYQLLQGDHRQPVALGLKDAAGRLRQVSLSRETDPAAKPAPSFEWRMLPGNVAYLAVNELEDDDGLKAFERALPEILRAKGLVLDLRRNTGGSDAIGAQILSYLTDQPMRGNRARSIDYVPVMRADEGPYVAWKTMGQGAFQMDRAQRYRGPVVLLIGPRTFSAAEDFVAAFRALKRGVLIGEATGGSTGEPLAFSLPGGGWARICAKRDTDPDGGEFIGKGIAPSIEVAPTVQDIRAGRDPVVARALALLRGDKDVRENTPAP